MGVSLSVPRLNLTHDQSNCVCMPGLVKNITKGRKACHCLNVCHLLADENEQSVENMIKPFVVFR